MSLSHNVRPLYTHRVNVNIDPKLGEKNPSTNHQNGDGYVWQVTVYILN